MRNNTAMKTIRINNQKSLMNLAYNSANEGRYIYYGNNYILHLFIYTNGAHIVIQRKDMANRPIYRMLFAIDKTDANWYQAHYNINYMHLEKIFGLAQTQCKAANFGLSAYHDSDWIENLARTLIGE